MKGKGKQIVPHGHKVMLAFPGGAGYGDPRERETELVRKDLVLGYITAETAVKEYGLSQETVEAMQELIRKGGTI